MQRKTRTAAGGAVATACAAMLLTLTGCQNFFVCDKASCPASGGGGTTTTANYVYASNSASGPGYIDGYTLAKGTLTAATSSPSPISYTPQAMAVSTNNSFLYVAAPATGTSLAAIYGYAIGSGGALTVLSSGNALGTQISIASIDVSPDGKWLIAATGNTGVQTSLAVYPLNTSTGLLGTANTVIYAAASGSIVGSLKVAPSGQFVALTLGTGGIAVFPFNTSTGVLDAPTPITFASGSAGAYDLAIDSNNYMYVAATGSVLSYLVSTAGVPGVQLSAVTTATGGPFSVAVDGTSFLYAGATNGSNSLVYGFSIGSGGKLTALSTATIAAPTNTTKLAVDRTKAYLVASGYDSAVGRKLYSIASTGNLTSLDTSGSGTSSAPTALVVTH